MESLMMRLVFVCLLVALCAAAHADSKPRALVVKETLPDAELVDSVAAQIRSAGYEAKVVDAQALSGSLDSSIDLLVLADSAHLPASVGRPIQSFLENGGDIIALRAPLWQTSLVRLEDRWLSRDEYQKETAAVPQQHVLFDFKPGAVGGWNRTANDMASPTLFEAGAFGPEAGTYALHGKISNLTGWDNFGVRDLNSPFPKGHTLTVFSAKGGPGTSQIAVEWDEWDGSRWITTVPVDGNWRRYVLRPEDFKYWTSNPKRGFKGDKFNPQNAVAVSFGLAFTHTGHSGGEHEFWTGPFGTANASAAAELLAADPEVKPFDLLTPNYKFFECTGVAAVTSVNDEKLPAGGRILSPQSRPEGRGFGKGRNWRFITLATARTSNGEWRGTPAAMMVHSPASPFKGGVWAAFGFQDPSVYEDPAVLFLIRQAAERIRRGLFLLEGGTSFFTYLEDEEIKCGAEAVNFGQAKASGVVIRQELVEPRSGKVVWFAEDCCDIDTHKGEAFAHQLGDKARLAFANASPLQCVTRLFQGGRVIDEIRHEAHVWRPKAKKAFMRTKDGQFTLNGKPWKAHGVNYMPSSGIGTEDGEYFEHWIAAQAYDPEIIQRDLEHVKDLGLNSVSVFIYSGSRHAGNLLDLLRRCEDLGLKVNLSLRPGTPMDFLWDDIRAIIERFRLWDNDTVFAYDLAWEPAFPSHEGRKQYDTHWEEWVKGRYGSIQKAEANWGYPIPKESGKVTNPPDDQFVNDGEWRRIIAAYRRFLDDLLYVNYNRARALVKSVDPNHLVSFRMSEAGNPTYNWDGFIPYDFSQLAAAVDFLAPEAYGRIGNVWNRVKPGWFERIYARWAAPDQPMIWAEVGVSTWDVAWMRNGEEKLRYQAEYFELFYKMIIQSGANGIYWWWYPGGYRYGESSDFGIINPDGSDRASSGVIRRNAKAFFEAPAAPKADVWIEIDRDADARGLFAVYEKAQKEFWKLIEQGKTPGLRTAGTGTTSANCPLLAVGNTRYHSDAPPKFLNAAFDKLEIRDAEGKWVQAKDGCEITVDRSKQVIARAVVRNLGEANWVAGNGPGAVELVCHIGFDKEASSIPHDTPKHEIISIENARIAGAGLGGATTVRICMRARGRAEFGEVVNVRLMPKYLAHRREWKAPMRTIRM